MKPLQFAASRFLGLIVVLWVLVTIVFLLETIIPSDPARVAAGPGATPAVIAAKRQELGLDKPPLERYILYLDRLVHGNLSTSTSTQRPVLDDLRLTVPASLELLCAAMVLNVGIGILVGLVTAVPRRGGGVIRFVLTIGASVPSFLLGLLLLLFFYQKLHIFPAGGRLDPGIAPPPKVTGFYTIDGLLSLRFDVVWSATKHLILPAITLALTPALLNARTLRASLRTVLRQDHVRTARAKGLRERTILNRHGLRNAVNPVLTLAGLETGAMLAGMAIVEPIFAWPGVGSYIQTAITNSDVPAIAGATLVIGIVYVVANLIIDLAQMWVDPRIRLWA